MLWLFWVLIGLGTIALILIILYIIGSNMGEEEEELGFWKKVAKACCLKS